MTSFHSTSPFRTSFSKQDPSSSNSSFKTKLNVNINDVESYSKVTSEKNSELNLQPILEENPNLSINHALATSYVTSSQMQGHFPFTNDIALGYEPSSLYPLNSTFLHEVELEENEARESFLNHETQISIQENNETHSEIVQDSLCLTNSNDHWEKRSPSTFSPNLVANPPSCPLNSFHLTPIFTNGQDVEGIPFSTPLLDVRPPMPLLQSPEAPICQMSSNFDFVHSRPDFPPNASIPLFPTAFYSDSKESPSIESEPSPTSSPSEKLFPTSFPSLPSSPSPGPSPLSPLPSFLPLSIIQEEPTYLSSFQPSPHTLNFPPPPCSFHSKNVDPEPFSIFPHSTSTSPQNVSPFVLENQTNLSANLNSHVPNPPSSSSYCSSFLSSLPSLALKEISSSIEQDRAFRSRDHPYPSSADFSGPPPDLSFLVDSRRSPNSASYSDMISPSRPIPPSLKLTSTSHSSPMKSTALILSEPLRDSATYSSLKTSLPLKSPSKNISHRSLHNKHNEVSQTIPQEQSNVNLQSPLMPPSLFNLPTIEDTLFFHKQDLHHQLSEPVPDTPLDEVIQHLQRHLDWTSASPTSSLLSSPLLSPSSTSPAIRCSDSNPLFTHFESTRLSPHEQPNEEVSVSLNSSNCSLNRSFPPNAQAFQVPTFHTSTLERTTSPLSVQPSFLEWERLIRPPEEQPSQSNLHFPPSPEPELCPFSFENHIKNRGNDVEVQQEEGPKMISSEYEEHNEHERPSLNAIPSTCNDSSFPLSDMDSNLKKALQAYPTSLSASLVSVTTLNLSHCHLTSCLGLSHATPHLVSCDLSHNELTYLTGLPTTLLHLNVSSNQLSNLTSFTPFIHLQSLDVSFNLLDEALGLNVFVGLNHLHTLYLNSVGHWDRLCIGPYLPSLTHFCFTHNQCTLVQLDPTKLPNLMYLDLSHNELPSLRLCPTEETVELPNVERVSPLDSSLAFFSKLQTLKLSSNAFTNFPYSHPTLTYLDLSDNLISILHMNAFPNLKHCFLQKNQLSQLSTCIPNMGLEYLDLSDQSMSSFPLSPHSSSTSFSPTKTFPMSISLPLSNVATTFPRTLILKGNSLDWSTLNLPFFSVLSLDLSKCNLTTLPSSFASFFPSLTYLSLSHNPFTSLPKLTSLPYLTHLMASSTELFDLSLVLSQLPILTLTHLDLRYTPLTMAFYPNLPNPKDVQLDQVFLNSLSDSMFVQRLMYRCSVTVHCTALLELDQLPVDRTLYLHYQTVMGKFMKNVDESSSTSSTTTTTTTTSTNSNSNTNSLTPLVTLVDKN